MKLAIAVIVGLACLLGSRHPAVAHAILVEVQPTVDATVAGPTIDVRLHFNVRIDRGRSRLTLVLSDGRTCGLKLLDGGAPDSLSAQATGLTPGAYRLHWQVLAVDGHITRGTIPFRVSGS